MIALFFHCSCTVLCGVLLVAVFFGEVEAKMELRPVSFQAQTGYLSPYGDDYSGYEWTTGNLSGISG